MAEERHDTSPLDNTVNAAIQTAKTAKQAKQVADGIKNAKMQQKVLRQLTLRQQRQEAVWLEVPLEQQLQDLLERLLDF